MKFDAVAVAAISLLQAQIIPADHPVPRTDRNSQIAHEQLAARTRQGRIENILWRLENGEIEGVNPKVIVFLGGTNNVGERVPPEGVEAAAANVTRGIEAVLRVMRSKAPDAVIVLMAIFPRNDNMAVLPEIERINAVLAKIADGRKIRYLNINDKLADKQGKLFDGVMNSRDRLHPTVMGYQIWADALKPVLHELLGPPAAEDHAPPPVGDPSAGS